ncbi:MAG: O-antigen ligase family protein [Elusimicrobia bacterium]|nr:O-antigen ligase family protein [Elusimicrobiota bacterium]
MTNNSNTLDFKPINWFVFLFSLTMAASISMGYIFIGFLTLVYIGWTIYCKQKPRLADFPLLAPFALYALWGIIASLCGIGFERSLRYWRADLLCFVFWLLYFSFKNHPSARIWAVRGFSISIAFLAITGLLQLAMIHLAPSVNEWLTVSPSKWIRAFAILPRHNQRVHGPIHTLTYAEVLALGAIFMAGVWRSKRWLGIILGILAAGALIASGSRGPALGLIAGLVVIAAGYAAFTKKFAWPILLPFLLSCLILFFLPVMRERFKTAMFLNKNQDRLTMWQVSYKIVRDNPLTGVGIAHIRTVWPEYFNREWKKYFPYEQEIWSDVHNLYFQQAGERGITGLIVLLILFGAITVKSFKLLFSDPENRDLYIATLACVAAFWVMNLTESAFQDTEVVFTLYLLLAIAWTAKPAERQSV